MRATYFGFTQFLCSQYASQMLSHQARLLPSSTDALDANALTQTGCQAQWRTQDLTSTFSLGTVDGDDVFVFLFLVVCGCRDWSRTNIVGVKVRSLAFRRLCSYSMLFIVYYGHWACRSACNDVSSEGRNRTYVKCLMRALWVPTLASLLFFCGHWACRSAQSNVWSVWKDSNLRPTD